MSLEDTVSILIIEFDVAALDIFVRILQQWNRCHFDQIAEIKANVIEKSDQTLQRSCQTVGIGYDKCQNRINERFLKLFGEKVNKEQSGTATADWVCVCSFAQQWKGEGEGDPSPPSPLLYLPLPAAPPTYHSQINNTPHDKNLHLNFGN
jgi:hypothetical protein